MPGSRLQIFAKSGHFPHLAEPLRFALVLADFIDASEPADFEFSEQDLARFRERLLAGAEETLNADA
jgi:hypothetical protein